MTNEPIAEDVLKAVRTSPGVDRKWWCSVLLVASPENPPDYSYRPGLPAYCKEENHLGCGWVLVVPDGERL